MFWAVWRFLSDQNGCVGWVERSETHQGRHRAPGRMVEDLWRAAVTELAPFIRCTIFVLDYSPNYPYLVTVSITKG
jgi:hypothetical protein